MRFSYKKALERLSAWARKEGYAKISLEHDDTSYIDWEHDSNSINVPKEIKIEKGHTYEIKTYLMLHELGHHQLRKDWDKFNNVLPMVAYAEVKHYKKKDTKYLRRVSYSVSCMEEEFKAWEEGYKLGIKLGIKIDPKKWTAFKTKCLMSYMRYYGFTKK
jgi:hypothetical protein